MKQRILRVDDSNMVGSWWYGFTLHSHRGGVYSLSLQQSARGEERVEVDPVAGLKTGVDVYDALTSMLSELGCESDHVDFSVVADNIAIMSQPLSEQFRRAPSTLERREQSRESAGRKREEAAFAPFADRVEAYVATFSNDKVRGGGMAWPSPRERMRSFLRRYIGEHGTWPQGTHEGHTFANLDPLPKGSTP